MQNNTIAFTILNSQFIWESSVILQQYTVYFLSPLASHRRGWYTFNFFYLAFPPSTLQSTIFFKGTYFALLVSCQIQTLASPWSISFVPKSRVLFIRSLISLPTSHIYYQVLHSQRNGAKDTVCFFCVIYAYNRNHFC